jgi:hypothetical protein
MKKVKKGRVEVKIQAQNAKGKGNWSSVAKVRSK